MPGQLPFCYTSTRKATAAALPSNTHRHTQKGRTVCQHQYHCTDRSSRGRLCKDTRLPSCLPAHVIVTRDNHPAPSLPPIPQHPHTTRSLPGLGRARHLPSLATHSHTPTYTPHTKGGVQKRAAVSVSRTHREADVKEQLNGCTGLFEAMGGLCNQMPAPPCLPAHVTDTTPTTAPHYHPPACAPHTITHKTPSSVGPLPI
jgi:hypothetical protein